MKNVQEVINKLINNDFSNKDLEQYLESSLVLVKANAIIAILRQNDPENWVIYKLNCISKNIQNEPKVIGEWTTGHYAMAVLHLLNTKETQKMYNDNFNKLDKCTKESINKLIEQIHYML